MGDFIKKVTAQKCPVHQAVLEECATRLQEKGYFSKAGVLDSLRLGAMGNSIRWDYIADFLSDSNGDYALEIVPLAQKFFSSTRADRLRESNGVDSRGRPMNLGTYLAGGHGKKTAGYAHVSFEGGLLALKRLERYAGLRNGVGKAFEGFREAVARDKPKLEPVVVQALEKIA